MTGQVAGVDVGGTFTDLVIFDPATGAVRMAKVPTTLPNQSGGVLDAFRIPYELARPQKWKKEFSCTSDKNTSIEVAQRMFPNADLRRTPKCKGPHDGICEALLMAEYARRRLG